MATAGQHLLSRPERGDLLQRQQQSVVGIKTAQAPIQSAPRLQQAPELYSISSGPSVKRVQCTEPLES